MAKEVNKENKKVKNEKDKKSFAKDLKAELKKVSWPTPKQLVNNTTAVIVIVLITATLVFILDCGFEILNKYGVEAAKAIITSNKLEQNVDNTTEGATVIDSGNVEEDTNTTEADNADTNTVDANTADANTTADTNTAVNESSEGTNTAN